MWVSTTSKSAFVYQILSKSGDLSLRYAISRFLTWWIYAIFNFRGPVMGSLKSPCRTSYRSSMETIALNCLVFEKRAFLCADFGDRQTSRHTYKRTDGQHRCVKAPLAIANGALMIWSSKEIFRWHILQMYKYRANSINSKVCFFDRRPLVCD